MSDPSIVDLDGTPVDIFHDLLTTSQAARLAMVTPQQIRDWARRGHLHVAARDQQGRPRYVGIDVAKAEAKTRRPHILRRTA